MTTRSAFAVLAVAAALLVGGCSGPSSTSGPPAATLPAAGDLLTRAAEAMSKVRTVALDITVDPALTDIPVRTASGSLTSTGDATGVATLVQGGAPVELTFVVTGGNLYLKGPTGGFAPAIPVSFASGFYDPTALLDPQRGVAKLLAAATGGVTQARESIDGVDSYRVAANLPEGTVAALVPGVKSAVDSLLWIDAATSRLVKAEVRVPTGGGTGPVTARLSDFDAPVTVTAPA